MHEPLVTRQEMPQYASYSGEVQNEHWVLKAGPNLLNLNPITQNGTRQEKLKCIQLNLQNSRLATDNINKIIEEEYTDILCL